MSVDFDSKHSDALRRKLMSAVELAAAADLDDPASRAALTETVTLLVAALRRGAPTKLTHEELEPLTDAVEAALAQALVERTPSAGAALHTALRGVLG